MAICGGEEVHLNLAYGWFCRLGLDGEVPITPPSARTGMVVFRESNLLRRVFETVLRRCIREGLVGGEAFAVDASLIKADANRQKGIECEKGLPPEATGRAIRQAEDDAAFGAATEVTPEFISPADPAARWTGAHGGQAFFAYSTNYLIDVDNAIIVDVEATTARFDLYPARLMGDSAYGSAEMLGWLVDEQGLEPHVTVSDKSARKDGTFSRDDFTYDHERDACLCPGGTMLTTTGTLVNDGATMLYRASKRDWTDCALKPHCCPRSRPGRCPAQSTKTLVIWRARLQSLGKVEYLDNSARRSRCCLRTSSGYSSWIDSDCEDRVAPTMSSSSQQPPRTFGNWPSWYRCPT